MQNIADILKEFGLEVPADKADDFNKKFNENYKTINEFSSKISKAEGERDKYKSQYETASETLKGFDGVDVKDLQNQIENWKAKAKVTEESYKKQLYERDFEDALSKEIEAYKFTSNSAKEAVMTKIKAAELKLVDGKIIGFNDMINSIKEKDATAFVDEEQQNLEKNKPYFSNPLNNSSVESVSGDPNKMDFATYKKWREQNK